MNLPLLLLLTLASPPVDDPLAGPGVVSEAMVLGYARAQAPALVAARHRLDAARAAVDAADPWPEPQLMLGGSPLPVETRNGPLWATARLSQRLPWADALDARRAAATAEASGAEATRATVALTVEAEALIAFHRLALSRAEARINVEMLAIATRMLRLAEDRLGVEPSRQGDVIRAQVEVARLETVAVDLEQQAITRQAELNAAIGRPPRSVIGPLAEVTPSPVADLDALLAAAADHPVLATHAARIDAARARLRGAETRGRPDLSAALSYALVGQPDSAMGAADAGRDALTIQLGVTLPVWGRSAYASERRAAAAELRAAQAARAAAEDVVAHRVIEQVVRAETALRRLRLYRETALPLAEQHLEVVSAAYAAGELPFAPVLDAEQTRESLAVSAARATADFAIARAALARAVGQPVIAAATPADAAPPDAPPPDAPQPTAAPGAPE